MSVPRGLVLDANILVRAVFGVRVPHLLRRYGDACPFYSPEVCFAEALKNIPAIAQRRRHSLSKALTLLEEAYPLISPVAKDEYQQYEAAARPRIETRDPDDWPIVATALLLNLPIWTEDYDFFGAGVATWTTDRVEIYLGG